MTGVQMTVVADTRQLETEVFPALLAYGRRTLQEQCVTSATFIAYRAQAGTPAADIATIDDELEVAVVPVLSKQGKRKGLPIKSGRKNVNVPDVSVAMMIAIARLHPNSKYSGLTGNRWPVAMPDTEGTGEFMDFMAQVAARMVLARHSSTHFLKTGWTPAIRTGMASEFFRYNPAFGSRREAGALPNSGSGDHKSGNVDALGVMTIDLTGDDCVVTASNDIGGEGTNDVLLKKYREALIEYGLPALEAAIAQEVADGEAELKWRMIWGWKIKYPAWA